MRISEIAALALASGAIAFILGYTVTEIVKWRKKNARWQREYDEAIFYSLLEENTGPCHNWKKEGF